MCILPEILPPQVENSRWLLEREESNALTPLKCTLPVFAQSRGMLPTMGYPRQYHGPSSTKPQLPSLGAMDFVQGLDPSKLVFGGVVSCRKMAIRFTELTFISLGVVIPLVTILVSPVQSSDLLVWNLRTRTNCCRSIVTDCMAA